jgi:hypothetical protein
VYWAGADDPIAADKFLHEALGQPYLSEQGFAIWLPTEGRWLPPAVIG